MNRTHRYLQNGTWGERALPAAAQGLIAKQAYFYVDRWAAPDTGAQTLPAFANQ